MLLGLVIAFVLLVVTKWLWTFYLQSLRDPSSFLALPPGDVGWPFIGDLPRAIWEMAKGNDYFTYCRLKYGNIYKTHLMGSPLVRVTGPENIKTILYSAETKSDSYLPKAGSSLLGPDGLINSSGSIHKMKRKITSQAFKKDALSAYTRALDKISKDELQEWSNEDGVKVFDMAESLALRSAWEVLVGMTDFMKNKHKIIANFETFLKGFWGLALNIPGTAYYKAVKANKELTKLILEEHEKKTQQQEGREYHDALSIIMTSSQDHNQPMNSNELVDTIRELLFAGHSTVSSVMTSLVRRLADNPRVLEKVREELRQYDLMDPDVALTYDNIGTLSYIGDVINEALRMDPPAGGGFRRANSTIEIGGFQIPKGWMIIWSILDTHEITDLFSDSREEFQPERWQKLKDEGKETTFHFMPFGAGSRACLGKEYAKILLRVFLINLVRKFDWTLKNPEVKMLRLPVRHPKDKLPTVFQPYNELGQMNIKSDETLVGDENMNITKRLIVNNSEE